LKKKIENKQKFVKNAKPKSTESFFNRHLGMMFFLISFLSCVIIFGVIAAFLMRSILPINTNSSDSDSNISKPVAGVSAATLNPSDTFNMLLAFTDDTTGKPIQFMLLRLDSQARRLAVMSIPQELKMSYNGANKTITAMFSENGFSATQKTFAAYAGIKIDYYCSATTTNLSSIVNSFGGITYNVTNEINYTLPQDNRIVTVKAGNQYLEFNKIISLISYNAYPELATRYQVQTELMKAFVVQKFSEYYLDNASTFFKNIFNNVNTNFSMNDLLTKLDSFKKISSGGGDYVYALTPTFTEATQDNEVMVLLDSKTKTAINQYFGS
jgi:anionic cell wall polymer biosynthesis LytR-Cps2A-Psr (LCP) family protein